MLLGRRPRRKPEVLMAPLIDVIFLLLIFYAVTTQFVSDQRLKLKLPEAETAESAGQGRQAKIPIVTVASDGSVWLDGDRISDQKLESTLKRLIDSSPGKAVILKGDQGADYGVVVRVLDVARSVGAESIQMSAVKPQKKE